MRDRHPVNTALLGVGRLLRPDREVEVELVEGGGADLAQARAGQHAETNDPSRSLVLVDGQAFARRSISSKDRNRSRAVSGRLRKAKAGLSGRIFQRTARLNILRITSPARFALIGVGFAGFSALRRFWVGVFFDGGPDRRRSSLAAGRRRWA